ncbi:hypothetical protein [Treponema primitia]|uniref:hypothetical protein n=1 Tax=Treponema primitia TaxID=88058 RepID=UPI00025558FA|nr:hypothetical protein [Treponema primitia]
MFNPKVSGIAAGIGFILSFLLGIITGAGFPLLLVRAFVFAAIFFALASAGYGAITMYLPELLDNPGEEGGLGSQVDISIGDDGDQNSDISLEAGGFGDGMGEILENPGDSDENKDSLSGNTLDQNSEDGYTGEGSLEGAPGPLQPALPTGLDFTAEELDSVDVLPDLDSMSGAFVSGSAGGGSGESGSSGGAASSGGGLFDSSGKTSAEKAGLSDDFNVHEMASAIQTILKREDKG